jgi:hypothetical protein
MVRPYSCPPKITPANMRNPKPRRPLWQFVAGVMGLADQARDKAERRWFPAHRAVPDGPGTEEALRQVGADILNEPIPDRLLQALQGKRRESEAKSERRN